MADLVTDQGPGSAGTAINAALLDAVVVAQSHIYNYTIPATSASLAQTFPSIEVVFNNGDNTASKVVVVSSSLSLTANNDSYVDVTPAGNYVLAGSVAINAAAPAIGTGNVRVYKATTGASTVTAIALAGPTQPLNVTQVQSAATVNAAGYVVQRPNAGIRQIIPIIPTADSGTMAATAWTLIPSGLIGPIAITIGAGSSIELALSSAFYNTDSVARGLSLRWGVTPSGGVATYYYLGNITIPGVGNAAFPGFTLLVTPGATTYSIVLQYQISGGMGVRCAPIGAATSEAFSAKLIEFA